MKTWILKWSYTITSRKQWWFCEILFEKLKPKSIEKFENQRIWSKDWPSRWCWNGITERLSLTILISSTTGERKSRNELNYQVLKWNQSLEKEALKGNYPVSRMSWVEKSEIREAWKRVKNQSM